MTDTPLSSAPPSEERLLHDVRAVADVVDVDLAAIASDAEALWVVLQTQPETHSGSATLRGATLDARSGRIVEDNPAATQPEPAIVREGQWRIISVLSGMAPATSGRYSWIEPRRQRTRGLPRDDLYDPFARPARVLCRFELGREIAPFDHVSVLPEGWEAHVADAVDAARRIGDFSPANADRVRPLLKSPNHMLFSQSSALLARGGMLDDALYEELLGSVHGYRRAVLHYVTLGHGQNIGQAGLIGVLERDLAGGTDERRAAALGLATAWLLASASTATTLPDWSPAIRPEIYQTHAQTVDDPYAQRALALLAGST